MIRAIRRLFQRTKRYSPVVVREDLSAIIYNISPDGDPFEGLVHGDEAMIHEGICGRWAQGGRKDDPSN